MKEEIVIEARKIIGKYFKEIAETQKLSMYEIAKRGKIKWDVVRNFFEGRGSSFDTLLIISHVLNQYVYFADKEKKKEPHDFEDLISKGENKHPDILK